MPHNMESVNLTFTLDDVPTEQTRKHLTVRLPEDVVGRVISSYLDDIDDYSAWVRQTLFRAIMLEKGVYGAKSRTTIRKG